jgi:integrase
VHHPAVPYAEVLRRHQGVSVKALEFPILTAARTSEVLGATWGEIDWEDAKVWTIPPERTKSKRQHRVPLSPPAIKLLRELYVEDGNPYLFIGSSQPRLGAATLQNTMRRLGRGETVHGFRSAFSDWAHERTAHSNHTIELSLAHSIGAATEQAYRRGDMFDKRRKLLEAWGAYCTSPAGQSDNVVPIQSKGAP